MKPIFLAVLLITQLNLFSQTYESEDYIISPAGEMYSLNYLNGVSNGRGNTGIGTTNNINSALMNPAGLRIMKNNQAGLQYSYKTTQKWNASSIYGDFSFETEHNILSVYAAYGKKFYKNLSAGLVYYNPSSEKYVNHTFLNADLLYNYSIHSINAPISYNFGKVSVGVNLMLNYYRSKMYKVTTIIYPDDPTEAISSYWRFNVQGGLLFTPSDVFSGGITVTPGFKAYPESDLPEISSNIKSVSKFPLKIGAGINYMPVKNKLNLLFDYNFAQTSDLEGYKDRHNFNLGAELKVNPKLTLRAGAFTFFDIRDFNSQVVTFPQPEGEHEQIFITLGGTVNLKNTEITCSVMDSHISKGTVKNTYFNLGVLINF